MFNNLCETILTKSSSRRFSRNRTQYAGIYALKYEAKNIDHMLTIYGRRRKMVLEALKSIGIVFDAPKGTFYLWVPVTRDMKFLEFTNLLFDKAAVVTAYGKYGEGYIRISLTVPDARLKEAMERMRRALA